ncbi:synaptosomal-associated protein 29 [Callorhinchus milii]|uniref:Synaptosomal-associated protein 29 n=1 Tax=Callorhinchus milii TaxID=7868 RepID=V9KSZ2_CALMI|nr:synaptosomal-associated protein 29 [Callorhinchus milii]|eukprot:gi/632967478/ref/XP_007900001.1/ PREDICTED: synaptosomal-associated protein 29 [Callorhinchus milii]
MAAYPNNYNPFAEVEEEAAAESAAWRRGEPGDGVEEEPEPGAPGRQRYLQQEVLRRAERTVQSSDRSVALIYESEKVGTETAEELMRQGEALKRTETMIDRMDNQLKTSQKHINSIKSIFGGIKNYFQFKKEEPTPSPTPDYKPNSKLSQALDVSKEQEANYQARHPNLQNLDTSGFGASSSASPADTNTYPKNQHLRTYHKKIDENLDEMSSGLGRLKGLALGLQSEIEEQDETINHLTSNTDNMSSKITATDRMIRKL